jgi:hypothetical protein
MPEQNDTELGEPIGQPIVVPASPVTQMASTLIRYLVVYVIGSLTAKALIPADVASLVGSEEVITAIVGFILAGIVAAWGALKSRKNVAVQQALAAKLPDGIARAE